MIKIFAGWLVLDILKIPPGSFLAEVAGFFVYDVIKIFFLLVIVIFAVSFIRTYISPEKTRKLLGHQKNYLGNILAAGLGIFTPFCTCSAIPLFLGFIEAGVPLGVTFSFLVAAPMINEVALVMLWGMFGIKTALLYIVSGLIIAIISGIIIGRLKIENLVEDFVFQNSDSKPRLEMPDLKMKDRLIISWQYTTGIIKKIWLFVILGIGVGAWIHGYVPADWLASRAGRGNFWAVPLAVLVGIPLYSNAAGVIPLVSALVEKGVPLGTALALMMAVTGLSLPEFLILRRVMKVKLILIFAGIVGAGIIFTGYLFNLIIK